MTQRVLHVLWGACAGARLVLANLTLLLSPAFPDPPMLPLTEPPAAGDGTIVIASAGAGSVVASSDADADAGGAAGNATTWPTQLLQPVFNSSTGGGGAGRAARVVLAQVVVRLGSCGALAALHEQLCAYAKQAATQQPTGALLWTLPEVRRHSGGSSRRGCGGVGQSVRRAAGAPRESLSAPSTRLQMRPGYLTFPQRPAALFSDTQQKQGQHLLQHRRFRGLHDVTLTCSSASSSDPAAMPDTNLLRGLLTLPSFFAASTNASAAAAARSVAAAGAGAADPAWRDVQCLIQPVATSPQLLQALNAASQYFSQRQATGAGNATAANATVARPPLLVAQLVGNVSVDGAAWPAGGVRLPVPVVLAGLPGSMQVRPKPQCARPTWAPRPQASLGSRRSAPVLTMRLSGGPERRRRRCCLHACAQANAAYVGLELNLANVPVFVRLDQQAASITVSDLCLTNMALGHESLFPSSLLVGAVWVVDFDRCGALFAFLRARRRAGGRAGQLRPCASRRLFGAARPVGTRGRWRAAKRALAPACRCPSQSAGGGTFGTWVEPPVLPASPGTCRLPASRAPRPLSLACAAQAVGDAQDAAALQLAAGGAARPLCLPQLLGRHPELAGAQRAEHGGLAQQQRLLWPLGERLLKGRGLGGTGWLQVARGLRAGCRWVAAGSAAPVDSPAAGLFSRPAGCPGRPRRARCGCSSLSSRHLLPSSSSASCVRSRRWARPTSTTCSSPRARARARCGSTAP